MNIWILNHYAITPDLPGGTRHFDFGRELVKRGYRVTIFSSSFHHSLHKETKDYKKDSFIIEDYEGVKFVWVKTFPYFVNNWRRVVNMLSYSIRVYRIGKTIDVGKPDIIIGSSVHLFSVYIAYLLAKRFKTPFIMEVRDLWPQTLIDMGVPKWNPFVIILSILERFLYKKANKIITLPPRANEYIERFNIPKNRIVWISNGVDLTRFNVSSEELIEDKGNNKFVVGYVGSIGLANNIDVAVRAAEILFHNYPEIKFVFIGDGPEKSKLLKIIKGKNLNNIEFKEPISKKMVPRALSKMDILFDCAKDLELSKYGLSDNKLFDYLASGKPIIFSANSINDPVKEAKAGITIPPDDPQELADAIIKLYRLYPKERNEIGINGRRYVEKYYSIPILIDKLEEIIGEVCNMKRLD